LQGIIAKIRELGGYKRREETPKKKARSEKHGSKDPPLQRRLVAHPATLTDSPE